MAARPGPGAALFPLLVFGASVAVIATAAFASVAGMGAIAAAGSTALVAVAALFVVGGAALRVMPRGRSASVAAPAGPDEGAPAAKTPSAEAADDSAKIEPGRGVTEIARARDAAEAANTTKSRYLVNVCHEMRSPLNAIYGYAQLLERGGEDIDPADTARTIRRCSEHLTGLVDGLVDIAQIQHGTVRVASDTVRFRAFLDHIASMFRNEAESKGLRFLYERPDTLPLFVRMDQKRVQQILINLLSNALKFTEAGEVRFRMTYSGSIARFEVSDTGPGIAAEEQERIFMPFERGSDSLARAIPGAGLGLAITRSLAQMLGGELTLDSIPGQGSTFRLAVMLAPVASRPPDREPQARIVGYAGPRRQVLAVDDDPVQLGMVRRFLQGLGFAVIEASGGRQALEKIADCTPDVALLDISMPGLSGWDVSRRLRERCGDALRIVMLSGNALEATGPSDGQAVAHDLFLTKPINFNALTDALGRLLDIDWVEDESAPVDPDDAAPFCARARAMVAGDEGAAGPTGAGTGTDAAAPSVATDGTAGAAPKIGAPLPETAKAPLAEIGSLLKTGHLSRLEKAVKAMADTVPETEALARRLLDCLDRMDLATMRRLVGRALK